jgi:hypothetical protein
VKQIITATRVVSNLQELRDALSELTVTSDPETVYLESPLTGDQTFVLHLVETILTDGSLAYSLTIQPSVVRGR